MIKAEASKLEKLMGLVSRLLRPFRSLVWGLVLFCLSLGILPHASALERDTAEAVIRSTTNDQVALGVVELAETAAGITLDATFMAVPPGKHGFHIHSEGSCADGGKAAGGHFNPDGVKHGYLITDGFTEAHAGDLGNVEIATDGTGTDSLTVPGLTLTGEDHAIANHAFIFHADPDDFGQPTGHAGGRIGCGVIELNE